MTVSYTPMMQQYREIKGKHPDEILFFRLGDFYEMFFSDAELASRELEITLTGREGGADEKIPMCGVPYHAAEGYIARLLKKGYRIAICEQTEDPRQATGLVKREVVKIITPGTTMNEQILEDKANQYLVLVYEEKDVLCLAAADITTGDCLWASCRGAARYEQAAGFIFQLAPAEIVQAGGVQGWDRLEAFCRQKLSGPVFTSFLPPDIAAAEQLAAKHFANSGNLGQESKTAIGFLLSYLYQTVKSDLAHLNRLNELTYDNIMVLDATAVRNLEVLKNMRDGSKKDTLLSVLDCTRTAMGGRQLKRWLEMPLLNAFDIRKRQQVVADLLGSVALRDALGTALNKVHDVERILSRVEVGTANARDLAALSSSLGSLPAIKNMLSASAANGLQNLGNRLELHTALYNLLFSALAEEPPFSVREGGMIKEGYDFELDELRSISRESRAWMADFETKQRGETGIKNLKVGYNKVFGYYIEVTKSNLEAVPANFVRKQTLANAERYIVPELKEFENKILGAQERIEQLEYHLFGILREKVRAEMVFLQDTARALADIDVFLSLAAAADRYNFIRPELNDRQEIIIKDGRHPVVERLLVRELFVPNDTALNMKEQRTIVITGPNMAGKSTYMRQVALIVLMAQVGSFIPAREASICPVDRIFTRVGASDDLASGQSTFMVEMTEVAQIVKYATANSLIILDEVGRGTSTYDGMSIARAVIEDISGKIKAKTLFATHYHELIELENSIPCLKNYSVAVKERGNEVVFLRRIIPGGADKSYGIHVAQLAGLPKNILSRAQDLLAEYSEDICAPLPKSGNIDAQPTLFSSSLGSELLKVDVATLTPLEAINKLFELQQQAKEEAGLP